MEKVVIKFDKDFHPYEMTRKRFEHDWGWLSWDRYIEELFRCLNIASECVPYSYARLYDKNGKVVKELNGPTES